MKEQIIDRRVDGNVSFLDAYIGGVLGEGFGNLFQEDKLSSQIKAKSESFKLERETLSNQIEKQYSGFTLNEKVKQNIIALKLDNTFTVTTGHQLNLLGGPAFCLYKIAQTISMAEKLSLEDPKNNFVPVFWLASEDHDLEEIAKVEVYGKELKLNNLTGPAVGGMIPELDSLKQDELWKTLERTTHFKWLKEVFSEAYNGSRTLAEATRFWVNSIFGDQGIVVVDGDDTELKKELVWVFEKEINENFVKADVDAQTEILLKQGGKKQVNPRELNFFYLTDEKRIRPTIEGGKISIEGLGYFTKNELIELLKKEPENFSPNALMRPIYQEMVLPNVMYVGGGGEVAYWLQLNKAFKSLNLPFPFLSLRNSIFILSKSWLSKWNKMQLEVQDVLLKKEDLLSKYREMNNAIFKFSNPSMASFQELILNFQEQIKNVDAPMAGKFGKETKAMIKEMAKWQKQMDALSKDKVESKLIQISKLKDQVFPSGVAQERVSSFLPFLAIYGKDLLFQILRTETAEGGYYRILEEE